MLNFNDNDLKINKELEDEIFNTKINCNCGKTLELRIYDKHIDKCENYKSKLTETLKQTVVKDVKQ